MYTSIFIVITFPEIQEYQEIEGFKENSSLINDEPLLSKYGSSAYFVNIGWLSRTQRETEDWKDSPIENKEYLEEMNWDINDEEDNTGDIDPHYGED